MSFERETGLEPATNSLEGCDSSQLSYSRISFSSFRTDIQYLLELLRKPATNSAGIGMTLANQVTPE